MKKIVFRVDSGSHIGVGHVMRCLTLAYEFKEKGFEIIMITKNHTGFLKSVIPSDYKVFVLDGGVLSGLSFDEKNNYCSWLGESWESDLVKTNEILKKLDQVELVVIDHYSIDEKYEKKLKCKKILIIDDLMNRKHSCDYLLDQNTSADMLAYKNLMEKETKFFLGPEFALIRREFYSLKEASKKRRSERFEIKKILVFFGGADVGKDCLKLANALTLKELNQYSFTFILNESHSTFEALSRWAKNYNESVSVFPFVENMAQIMSEHDFFIGAGGATSWERICLGMPSAIIAVAENQIKICESLNALKLSYYLGQGQNITSSSWHKFFTDKIIDINYFQKMSELCFMIINGNGALNVVQATMEGLQCV